MSYATILAQIKTTLDTVTDVGRTHDYMRWAIDESAFLDLAKTTIGTTDQIRVWMIDYLGFNADSTWISRSTEALRVHTFVIHGYMGLDDSEGTGKTFATLAETVCTTLDDDTTLKADALSEYVRPCQLAVEHVMFYSKLCHHATVTMEVAEIA
jgi:hypothetical protein